MALVDAAAEAPWVPSDSFGARLALVRQVMGWNVAEAAKECGVSDESWRKWEHGRSPRTIHALARTVAARTGCDYVWLLAGGPLRKTCFALVDGTVHAGQQVLHLPVLQSV